MTNLTVNQMFYTPVSQQELIERVEQIAKASDNPELLNNQGQGWSPTKR